MKKIICSLIAGLFFFLSGCITPPGQIKEQTAPGQIKKTTGNNPVSIELGGQIEVRGEYKHDLK
ncbi:MAG: hypothetical protein HZB30_11535 [Nitrospirae bacterium]|nr:hypothetical protein [Nitrospirota bacterium]